MKILQELQKLNVILSKPFIMLLIISLVLSALTVIFHTSIEAFALNSNFPWTLAKILPYFLCLTFGAVGFYSIYQLLKARNKAIGIIAGILLINIIFWTDFKFHPIYQGDFSNGSEHFTSDIEMLKPGSLNVFAIPGCPFCHASIESLKTIKKRTPELEINFMVCSLDSTSLTQYEKPIGGDFTLRLLNDSTTFSKLNLYSFPTFIFTDKQGKKYRWSNDTFGAPAKDFVERNVK